MLEIARVPVLSDNYVWLVHEPESGETTVDRSRGRRSGAGRGRQRAAGASARSGTPTGIPTIPAATPRSRRRPAASSPGRPPRRRASRPSTAASPRATGSRLGEVEAEVHRGPGPHRRPHRLSSAGRAGRSSSATPCSRWAAAACSRARAAQMYANLQRLAALPPKTPGSIARHEYTLANGRFALTVEPDNEALVERMARSRRRARAGEATVPTTIALERATNPFMRAPASRNLPSDGPQRTPSRRRRGKSGGRVGVYRRETDGGQDEAFPHARLGRPCRRNQPCRSHRTARRRRKAGSTGRWTAAPPSPRSPASASGCCATIARSAKA